MSQALNSADVRKFMEQHVVNVFDAMLSLKAGLPGILTKRVRF